MMESGTVIGSFCTISGKIWVEEVISTAKGDAFSTMVKVLVAKSSIDLYA